MTPIVGWFDRGLEEVDVTRADLDPGCGVHLLEPVGGLEGGADPYSVRGASLEPAGASPSHRPGGLTSMSTALGRITIPGARGQGR